METIHKFIYQIKKSPLTLVGIAIIFTLLICALMAPRIAPYDPYEIDPPNRLKPPSLEHLCGTDTSGRDIFSRIIYGSRISLLIGFSVVTLAMVFGSIVGLFSGYIGGKFDDILMRVTDIFFSFPYLILAMAIAVALGPHIINAMLSLAIVWWPIYARLMRSQVLQVRESTYIESAKGMGKSKLRIIFGDVTPNCSSTIIVQATLDFGNAIMYAASLSFIGLGAQPPMPEWGAMISIARHNLIDSWWYPTFPGLAILITVLGCNLFGDGIRDMLDPRYRE